MKNIFKIASFLTVVFIIAGPVFTFAGGPGFNGGVDDGGGACAVPLDGGLSLLVAAGLGYGAKKFTTNRRKLRNKKRISE